MITMTSMNEEDNDDVTSKTQEKLQFTSREKCIQITVQQARKVEIA